MARLPPVETDADESAPGARRRTKLERGRLEAMSDGVIAVIITIMVLELKVPHGADLAALGTIAPTFAAYVVSFVNVGAYWNNHHHLLRAAPRIDGRVMWANLHLLFWLSLIPFTTAWLGENRAAAVPTAVYGFVLLCAGIAYALLGSALIAVNGRSSTIARAIGSDLKGRVSLLLCGLAIAVAFAAAWLSDVLFVAVSVIWFMPDLRVERALADAPDPS